MSRATVTFIASGYGSETRSFKTKDTAEAFIKSDAAEIAAAHGGEVVDYGNGEWGGMSKGGMEIARWEIS